MKSYKKYYVFLLMIPLMLFACKKEQIMVYKDDPGVFFAASTYPYSFTEDIGSQEKTINLPLKISGMLKNFDRSISVEAVFDSTTTATSDLFEIRQGIVPKNSVDGTVSVKLKRNANVDTSVVYLKLKLILSNDFTPILNNTILVSWTGKVIQPVNWNWLRYYFGTPFSTGWYLFMLKEAGVSSFPYHGTLSKTDPVTWWMSANQLTAYALKVKEALIKYNAEHPGNEMKHNDGPYAGQIVTMPI